MYGTREQFEYLECNACGTMRIGSIPHDLGKHYPAAYYSLHSYIETENVGVARGFLRRRLANHMLGNPDPLGWALSKAKRSLYPWFWFRVTNCNIRSPILDVGCGQGDCLRWLWLHGFRTLRGIDPYLSDSVSLPGLLIEKKSLYDAEGEYQLVMSHHSLEHMPEPMQHLAMMKALCRRSGFILIRMPVLNASWRVYGRDWIELDAPRHLWIPTIDGLKQLIGRVGGLRIESVSFDTTEYELSGSEMYRRDIPMHEFGKWNDPNTIFSASEIEGFRSKAAAYNRTGEAGRVVMIIRRDD